VKEIRKLRGAGTKGTQPRSISKWVQWGKTSMKKKGGVGETERLTRTYHIGLKENVGGLRRKEA